ncbi:MAG: chloride channel protein [Hyphomicrobium sp.]|uniref:chloride channel protein n=1 Tax=Hyphomicrobium sp. TaxID=82 RepID=UPI0039E22BBF
MRRYHYVGLSRRIWLRRAIFFSGAVLIGLVAVGFAQLADASQNLYSMILKRWPWLPFFIAPAGFAALAYVTARWFPESVGSGIPQVIAARRHKNASFRKRLLGWPTMVAKIVMTAIALVFGASVGREGPTVQVGASVMYAVAGFAGIGRHNGLVLAGSAAGIAAAFNAPIAGILFAIEEVAKSYAGRINELVIASVAIAAGVSWLILGNYSYLGVVSATMSHARDWISIPVCALLGGLMGGFFSRSLVALIRRPPAIISRLRRRPAVFAAFCGFIVAALSIATGGYASGNGYAETHAALVSGNYIPFWYGPFKLVSTLLSSASGIPGGLFSPSLAVGAGLGSMVTPIFPFIEPSALILMMTVGYFSAVVQSPLTAVVIVMEMTSDRNMVIPLMATSLLAAGISRLVQREPLYHALSYGFKPSPEEAAKAPPR